VLDYITVEWANLMPELLGRLVPLVRDIPPGRTLSDFYRSPRAEPPADNAMFYRSAPSPLLEVFAIRAVLRESSTVPAECAHAIQIASERVAEEREKYRRTYCAPRETRAAARHKLFTSYAALQGSVMEGEFVLLERKANWDRVVCLLRGNTFFGDFDFDLDVDYPSDMDWINALPREVISRPL
jgi:hypothetical protein